MFEDGVPAEWLQRARWVVYAFFAVFALAGVGYVFYSAIDGKVIHALLGAGIAWGSIGLGIAMHCVIQLATVVDANVRGQDEVRKRQDALEALVEELSPVMHLSSLSEGGASSLIAAAVDDDGFPRLAPGEGSAVVTAPAAEKESTAAVCEGEVGPHVATCEGGDRVDAEVDMPAISELSANSELPAIADLRKQFRDAIYAQDFTTAIDVGETIAEYHPESACAVQFDDLRDVLYARTAHYETQLSGPGVTSKA